MSAGGGRICVLGLGNLMCSDDAVGMIAAQRLAQDARLPREVEVVEGGTLGLDLLDSVHGVSRLLVLDAVDTGVAPGTLTRFAGEELARLPTSKSVHLLGLLDLMNVLRLMDAPPIETVLLGVQPESTELGTTLTPAVEAAVDGLIERSLEQIEDWAMQGCDEAGDLIPELAAPVAGF
jgi:hydrogenase maturation protease